MKKIILTILTVLLSVTLSFSQTAPVVGDGSAGSPYEIGTFDNLLWIQANDAEWDKHYIQTANIVASPVGSENWDRIGTSGSPFTGNYNGQNHTIDGLVIDTIGISTGGSANQRGFFGVDSAATISNLGLTNISVTNLARIGALVGESRGGTITNCYSTGAIHGAGAYIGGLIGYCTVGNPTDISNCHSECTVDNAGTGAYLYAGGFVGFYENGTITNCYSTGNVTVNSAGTSTAVGGFVARTWQHDGSAITISECYSTGDVVGGHSGNWSPTGGFIGYLNKGTIEECYSHGNVAGFARTGGFVGYDKSNGSVLRNCYSLGNVTRRGGGASDLGGFVGYFRYNDNILENCYSIGSVSYDGATNPTDKGFMGYRVGGTVVACFFDKDVSAQTSDMIAVAQSTLNMKTESTFTDSSWDFGSIWEIIAPAAEGLAKVNADGEYPRLQNQQDPALPVELTTFTASANGNTVSLLWSTATEVNNHGFSVERKVDAGKWNELGFVNGAGNSSSPKNYSYSDAANLAGKYYYRLKQVDIDGSYEYSQVVEIAIGVPDKFEVSQNYPNPFNPTTVISFSLPSKVSVEIVVYNAIGEVVSRVLNEDLNAGVHKINFDGSNLTSGIYFYKVSAGNNAITQKMILMK